MTQENNLLFVVSAFEIVQFPGHPVQAKETCTNYLPKSLLLSLFSLLDDTTRCSVERKRGWRGIGAAPGGLEARFDDQGAAGGDARVTREIGHCDRAAGLREIAVPAERDSLPGGERELQRPAVNRRGTRVRQSKDGFKAAGPLADDPVMHLAGERGRGSRCGRGCPGWCRRRRRSLRRRRRRRRCT